MKDSTMKLMVLLAKEGKGPISKIANDSVQQNIVLVTQLEPKLKEAKYDVQYEDKENGAFCRVFADDTLKACGYSSAGQEDALLHAVYGACREENAAAVVQTVLGDKEVPADVRTKLENAYALESPIVNNTTVKLRSPKECPSVAPFCSN